MTETMVVKEKIDDIRGKLEEGQFRNEASVSQGIVLRLLDALAWDTHDIQVVSPEFGIEGTRVDFALCYPPSKPLVFIEVKQVGKIEGAERQLFEYAFHEGVPIAILTDGREWHFFHPSGHGNYEDRRVYKLDLIERGSEESATRLIRYLNYDLMRVGKAIQAIKDDYQDVAKRRQIEISLPEAWRKLVQEKDEFLLDVVAEKTESLCGYRPTNEKVLTFLKKLKINSDSENGNVGDNGDNVPRHKGCLFVTMSNGDKISHKRSSETFVEAIEKLGIERVKSLNIVNIIPLVSTTKDRKYAQRKSGKYYVMTGNNTKIKKSLLEKIAASLGESLSVEIVD